MRRTKRRVINIKYAWMCGVLVSTFTFAWQPKMVPEKELKCRVLYASERQQHSIWVISYAHNQMLKRTSPKTIVRDRKEYAEQISIHIYI